MEINELNSFLKEFQNETDRAAAILGVAYLEDVLSQLFKKIFINNEKFIEENVLGDSRNVVLDTFSKKIATSYALGLLREKEYKDLEIIRRIRNKFAHSMKHLSFEQGAIRDQCLALKIAEDVIKGPLSKANFSDCARLRFIITVGVIGNFLSYRTEHEINHRDIG